MTKMYSIELECGCLIAEDTGTKEEPNGDAGLISCGSETSEIHIKCMKEYFGDKNE